MTDFVFNSSIPAAANNPSVDQTPMLNNNVSNAGIWNIDHIGFNAANGGTHTQISFLNSPNYLAPPAPPGAGTRTGYIYTAAGNAANPAQAFFLNSNANVLLSGVRAFAYSDGTGTILGTQSINITSIVHTSAGVFTVTLTTNAVTSDQFLVLATCGKTGGLILIISYTITGIGVFTINVTTAGGTPVDPTSFSFIVIQI